MTSHRLLPQSDCAAAWLHAARFVDRQKGHESYNVLFDVLNPTEGADPDNPIVGIVDKFLRISGKSVISIANTIFPNALYRKYGAQNLFQKFHDEILPKIRRGDRWSGYYFERMTSYTKTDGQHINQLWSIMERIQDTKNRSLNRFELSIYDPERDIDNSPYGGQCLSFLSFKLLPGRKKKLALTAIYRNHYYIEKLLGNLIGLGWLMAFVSKECGVDVGSLTILSTHAVIDQPHGVNRTEVSALLEEATKAQV